MSKRRVPGTIAVKKENAGFIGQALIVRVPTTETLLLEFTTMQPEENNGSCMMSCGDPDCVEFANIEVLDSQTMKRMGWACHVSECELNDLESTPQS
jgi:hypothetical protein